MRFPAKTCMVNFVGFSTLTWMEGGKICISGGGVFHKTGVENCVENVETLATKRFFYGGQGVENPVKKVHKPRQRF